PLAAAGAALISPLISTDGLFGIDYGSYVWRGSGLFTQLIAVHVLLLALGLTYKSFRGSGKGILAGLVLGLAFLTHFVYGFIGMISALIMLVTSNELPLVRRLTRLVFIGLTAVAVSAFELIPAFIDSPFVNHSRWEAAWKWNSFGMAQVLKLLVTGNLMD